MPSDELYLQDIIGSCNDVERFLIEVEKEEFLQNELLQNSVLLKLIVIGEAASRISAKLRESYDEIPWKAIIGFRNIAVPAYFSIVWEIVWNTATTDLGTLREQALKILETDFPNFQLRQN